MQAGRLRHRLVLEQRAQSADDGGTLLDAYATVATVWGAVEAVRGSVYAAGLQLEERITHRITIRGRALGGFDFIRHHGTTHRFKSRDVRDVDGRGAEIEIMAEEISGPTVPVVEPEAPAGRGYLLLSGGGRVIL